MPSGFGGRYSSHRLILSSRTTTSFSLMLFFRHAGPCSSAQGDSGAQTRGRSAVPSMKRDRGQKMAITRNTASGILASGSDRRSIDRFGARKLDTLAKPL